MLGPSLVMMDHPVTRQWNGNTTVTKAFFHKRFSETAQKYFRTRIDSCFRFLVAFIKPSSIVECGIWHESGNSPPRIEEAANGPPRSRGTGQSEPSFPRKSSVRVFFCSDQDH